jgi:hypothetical protein
MTSFQKVDRCLHLAVARPLALAVYGTWRGLRLLAAGARRALARWRRGAAAPAARA